MKGCLFDCLFVLALLLWFCLPLVEPLWLVLIAVILSVWQRHRKEPDKAP